MFSDFFKTIMILCDVYGLPLSLIAFHGFHGSRDMDVRELVDVGRLLVNEPGWRLVEKRAEALHVDALVLGGEDVRCQWQSSARRSKRWHTPCANCQS